MLLQTADYNFTKNNPNWDLVLDFKIDVGGGEEVNKKVLRKPFLNFTNITVLYFRVKWSNVLLGALSSPMAKKR